MGGFLVFAIGLWFVVWSGVDCTVIFAEPFTNYTYQARFTEQYSYDQHSPTGEKNHFKIVHFNGKPVLNISLLYTDLTFQKGSPTEPRSELREKLFSIPNDQDFAVQWDWYLAHYVPGYWFCFMQLFMDTSPNIMLRWELDKYYIWAHSGHVTMKGNIADDVGKWLTWRVEFRLSTDATKGYVRVKKNGVQVGAFNGVTAIAGISSSYFKQGIYTQHGVHAQDTTTLISNLIFEQN